jgi:hypothetical protein
MRNGRDTVLDHEEDPVNLLAMTWPPEQKCSRVIKQTAILTFLDGINPFHHLVMVFRRVFAALVTFQVNAGVDDLTDCVFVAWRGFEPERYYEKFGRYLEPGTNMTPFDGALVHSICRGGLTVLSNRSGPICFSRLLVGSTPFGWDMDLKPDQGIIAVNFAGVLLARLVAETVLSRAATAAIRPGGVVVVVRRGRREFVNESAVLDAVRAAVAPAPVDAIDYDRIDFRTSLEIVSRRLVLMGVHGAALTNLMFLPESAGVVEVAIAADKQTYYILSRSFGKRYYIHPHIIPTDTHLAEVRQRRVAVDRLPDLAQLCASALSAAERMSRRPGCC